MHIAVNALLVHEPFSGVQHAIVHQLRALLDQTSPHRFTVIALEDVDVERHLGSRKNAYTIVRAPVRTGQRLKRILWEQVSLPPLLRKQQTDLLYAPGYLTSLNWEGPSVVFIHDTIALSHPHLCTFSNALNYRALLPPSARSATRVAVPSHASAEDVAAYCHVPADHIDVVPLGVEFPPPPTQEEMLAARGKLDLQAPFLLAVSMIEPKKNFANLIRWFDTWKAAGIPHHLVIVGKWGWKCGDVRHALKHAHHRVQIHLPGYLPQAELPAIMATADLLLMPSRYEGFGLPALEAMAIGTPVVASDRGALPETVGDAGLVLPLENAVWEAEIPTLLRQPDRLGIMRTAGIARASSSSWEHTAAGLFQVFDTAIVQSHQR